jgi:hypothetical protein
LHISLSLVRCVDHTLFDLCLDSQSFPDLLSQAFVDKVSRTVKLLLKYGCDPNALSPGTGMWPLQQAVCLDYMDFLPAVVRLLVKGMRVPQIAMFVSLFVF